MPVTINQIEINTWQNGEWKQVLQYLIESMSLKDMKLKDSEFSLQDGCIVKENKIFIPLKYCKQALSELHGGHMTKMKLLARGYCYCKNIDRVVENLVKTCSYCRQNYNIQNINSNTLGH